MPIRRLLAAATLCGLWITSCPAPVAGPEHARTAAERAGAVVPDGTYEPLEASEPIDLAAFSLAGTTAAVVAKADDALRLEQPRAALELLHEARGPAADLLRARALRLLGKQDEAAAALEAAAREPGLAAHVALERGLLAWSRGDGAATRKALLPLIAEDRSVAERAAVPLTLALSAAAPALLLEKAAAIEAVLPDDDPDARSLWLEAQAAALHRLGRTDDARAMRLRRYLEEPVSLETPADPPEGVQLTPTQLVARAQVLLDANRNERVIEALERLPSEGLDPQLACQRGFALGLASRKLRRYSDAERYLGEVVASCADEDLVRRAMYLQAKVVSIRSGLRAIPIIEAFAKRFQGDSMVDDVLFWAGDMYQRRKLYDKAAAYYHRIEKLPAKDDYCGEARWRLAWMDFSRGRLDGARAGLQRILRDDGCAPARFDHARARYWLGRVAQIQGDTAHAAAAYRATTEIDPLGFYSQLALSRLLELDRAAAGAVVARLTPPKTVEAPALCPGFLASDPAFGRGLALLRLGLRSDAAAELESIAVPTQDVLAPTHAAALGVEARPARPRGAATGAQGACSARAPQLLLSLLLDRAGDYHDAHWRLRTDFGDKLARIPRPQDYAIWRAAYPLAFREQIAPAEQESELPPLLLQALCREESALDPQVVSWAGAYGLTQLLLSSGQAAGRLLQPPVEIEQGEDLLDPAVSARLGGALLSSLVREFDGNVALALAAYNAGDDVAVAWWKRHQGQPFDIFAEEMTIKETRGYVARVLKTFGVYRWLYEGKPPTLPIESTIPAYRH